MPLAYEKVQVSDPIDLRLVAEWTNAPIDDIEALNPELRRWTTPVRSPKYEIKMPVGTGDAFRARLAETPAENLNAFQWHSVKRGETLLSISRKLKVRQADLAEANSLTLRSRVQTGQQLIIPRAPTTLLAARPENPAPETVLAESQPACRSRRRRRVASTPADAASHSASSTASSAATRCPPSRGSTTRRSRRSSPGTPAPSAAAASTSEIASRSSRPARLTSW